MAVSYVFSLTGWPGTGKYTVAKELVAQLEARGHETRLVDNHSVSNPVLGVVRIDPEVAVPPEVWDRVREVRTVVYDSIATLSPPEWSFVFTNYVADTPADRAHYERLEELADAWGSRFVPVRMTVEVDELLRRMTQPERAARMKMTNADLARRTFLTQTAVRPAAREHARAGRDAAWQPPVAATRIIEHAFRLPPVGMSSEWADGRPLSRPRRRCGRRSLRRRTRPVTSRPR